MHSGNPLSGNPVSKEEYATWEREVVQAFFEIDSRPSALTPTDGSVAILSKEKFLLVALIDDSIPDKVASSVADLPAQRHWRCAQPWHNTRLRTHMIDLCARPAGYST